MNPRAGLAFADFETGDLLQMTGRAEIVLGASDIAAFPGAERLWQFWPKLVLLRERALPLRFALHDAARELFGRLTDPRYDRDRAVVDSAPNARKTMLREIVLDTETTGTDARAGDRLIEIGCVELVNHIRTGRTFHRFVNPERPVSEGAFNVHGISDAFLADKPVFADVVDALLDFLGDARLVIHNAAFDVGFLNAEFARLGPAAPAPIALETVVDTLLLARRKHPNAANSLDALCSRYGIDAARRAKHGALLDAQILAEVYIELLGGKQASLGLAVAEAVAATPLDAEGEAAYRPAPQRSRLSPEERERHAAFVATLGDGAVWRDYLGADGGA